MAIKKKKKNLLKKKWRRPNLEATHKDPGELLGVWALLPRRGR
jgi:hypothetical protein